MIIIEQKESYGHGRVELTGISANGILVLRLHQQPLADQLEDPVANRRLGVFLQDAVGAE